MSNISKVAKTIAEITADYQKLSDLNVAFYNQDINTSILQFNVTRNDTPVPLGKVNVDGYIVLLHEDGSRIQDNLVIENEEQGVIQYTIPREFLKHTGKALGQIYIAVKGKDDTAVMRQFSFDIKQDLLTGFSSSIKLEYIKTFDDLQTQIKQRVEAIEEAIANGEDYVAQMIATLDTAKKEIADTVSKATTDVNKAATDATKKITDTSNTAVTIVTEKADEVVKAIENGDLVNFDDIKNYQSTKIWSDKGGSLAEMQLDLLDIKSVVNFDGYVANATNIPPGVSTKGHFKRNYYGGSIIVRFTPFDAKNMLINTYDFVKKIWMGWENVVNHSDIENAQMQKITADNGAPLYDLNSTKDLFAEILTWGNGFFTFYLSAGATNNPTGTTSWLRGTVSTYGKNSNILAYDESGTMYVVVCANGVWGAWDKSALSSELQVIKGSNTGWLPLPLLNGVTAATPCFYRFYSTNGIYYLSFKGTLNTLSTRDVIIAKLPAEVTTKIDRVLTWIGNTSVSASTARFNRWSIETDGAIKFTASSLGTAGESGAWNPLDITLTI